ncbi:MAG: hypothetical protein WCT12_17980 [Verrucomicrobiota bacterium]
MKITSVRNSRMNHDAPRFRRREEGMAVIVVIAILAILLVYVAGNIRALYCLGAELRLVEKQQKQRLETAAAGSNVSTNPVQKSKIHNGPK